MNRYEYLFRLSPSQFYCGLQTAHDGSNWFESKSEIRKTQFTEQRLKLEEIYATRKSSRSCSTKTRRGKIETVKFEISDLGVVSMEN